MQNPAAVTDANGEWFEVYNPMSVAADLNGLSIQSGSSSHVDRWRRRLLLLPGQYLVLGINGETASNGGVPVDYQYTGIALSNGSDSLSLLDRSGSQIIDSVSWDDGLTFPDPTGASMALADPALSNELGSNWCPSRTPFGDGDLGTPGAENDCLVEVPQLVINEIMANPAVVSGCGG